MNKITKLLLTGIVCLGIAGLLLFLGQRPAVAPDQSATEQTYTLIVYGDSRNGEEQHRQLVSLMLEQQFAAVLHLGDIAYRGDDQEAWQTFWDITQPLRERAPYWVIEGNHENPQDQFPLYFEDELGNHTHTLDQITFLFLDLEQGIDQAAEYVRQNAVPQTIVLMHYPVFTGGPHAADQIVQQAAVLHNTFQEYGISLVFSGHDHNYQRILRDGITYIVSGGGGAPLYDVEQIDGLISSAKQYHYLLLEIQDQNYNLQAIDLEGNILDKAEGTL